MKSQSTSQSEQQHGRGLWLQRFICVVLTFTVAQLLSEFLRPELLLVGPVTVDVFADGTIAPGGSITYAAQVAQFHGIKACIVTAVPPEEDLSSLSCHEVHRINANATQTFEHTYSYNPSWFRWWTLERQLRLTANPSVTLSRAHVPWRCRYAKTVMLGPLMPSDVDSKSFAPSFVESLLFHQSIGLMAQGYQRDTDGSGKVYSKPDPHPNLMASLHPSTTLFLSDVETEPWSNATIAEIAQKTSSFVITCGADGAMQYTPKHQYEPLQIPVHKIDKAENTNGAGDTFASSYMLARAAGARDPGAEASYAASRLVLQAQACKPSCATVGMKPFDGGHRSWSIWRSNCHQQKQQQDSNDTTDEVTTGRGWGWLRETTGIVGTWVGNARYNGSNSDKTEKVVNES